MAAEAAPAKAGAWPDLRRSLRLNGVLVGAMLGFVASTLAVAWWGGVPFSLGLYAPLWPTFGLLGGAAFALKGLLPARWRIAERLALAAPVLLVAPAFFSAFTSLKSGLARLHPYSWDATIGGWDRALFGQDAWRVLQPMLGHPPITFALSVLYSGWHVAMLTLFGGLCFSLGRPALRAQALLALVACWALLGTWAATALASVGPCFVGPMHVAAPDGFAPQAAYLEAANRQLPIWEFVEQNRLLDAAAAGKPVLGSGISAMPSMHVAVAMLMMLVAWRFGRRAGIVGSVYFVIILLGSVHLGWHYAMDGLAGAAGAWLLWLAAGPIARQTTGAPAT